MYGADLRGFPKHQVTTVSLPFKYAMLQFMMGIFNRDEGHPLHLFQGFDILIEYIGRLVMPCSDWNPIPVPP